MGKGNLNHTIKLIRELGIVKKGLIIEEHFSKISAEWLKVLVKYYTITDRYSAREINEILSKRRES